SPLRGAPDFAQGREGFEDVTAGNGHQAARDPLEGVTLHGPSRRSRILHPKVWIATGLAAFAIAAAVLTLPELIFGGAVTTKHRTTLFGGGSPPASTHKQKTATTPAKTQPQTTVTETVPAPAPTDTATAP